MNAIENLRNELQRRFPDATFSLTAPLRPDDQWTLDIRRQTRWLVVDWTPPNRFGISSASDATLYGEGADELHSDFKEVLERIDRLLSTEEQVSPPLRVLLSRIREDRNVTQAQLALKLGVTQATISGIERRKDVQLSTLQRFIEAMGGILRVIARFEGASYVVQVGDPPQMQKLTIDPGKLPPAPTGPPFVFSSLDRRGLRQTSEHISKQTRERRGVLAA